MNKLVFVIVAFFVVQSANTANLPQDFMFPKMHNNIRLNDENGNFMWVTYAKMLDTFGSVYNSIRFMPEKTNYLASASNGLSFNFTIEGSNVQQIGYEYTSPSLYSTSHAFSEKKTWITMPEEAWASKEGEIYYHVDKTVKYKTKISYGNVKLRSGKTYFSVIVQTVNANGKVIYTMTFGKNVGLIQYSDSYGIWENDLWHENTSTYISTQFTNEESLRKELWRVYKVASIIAGDTMGVTDLASNRHADTRIMIDSLSAFASALGNKGNTMNMFSTYLLASVININTEVLHVASQKIKITDDWVFNEAFYAEWALYLWIEKGYIQTFTLKTYINNIEKNRDIIYSEILESNVLAIGNKSSIKRFNNVETMKTIGLGKKYLKDGISSKTMNNENVYNYLAYAYQLLGNNDLDLYYNILAGQQFLKGSDEVKAQNIEYAKTCIKDIGYKKTQYESTQIMAINILENFKVPEDALKKAKEGYEKGFNSKIYGFTYAELAKKQKSTADLRKAIDLLDPYKATFTLDELKKMLSYWEMLENQAEISYYKKEIEKGEKEQNKVEKKKETSKKRSRGMGFPINLAVSTNPANLLWNTFPLAADLRIGGTIHQFRINTHSNRVNKNMWGNYATDNDFNDKKEWNIIKGQDYQYALQFILDKDYKNGGLNVMFFGLQAGYGIFNLKPENVVVKNLATNTNQMVGLDPTVTRYTGAVEYGYTMFSRKYHYYLTNYYIFGAGMRNMDYGYTGNLDLEDKEQADFSTNFESNGYRQNNWNKFYGVFNIGVRLGITLF